MKFENSGTDSRISETDSKIVNVRESEKKHGERGNEMKEKDVEKESQIESNEDIEYFNFQSKWLSNVRVQCNQIYQDKELNSEYQNQNISHSHSQSQSTSQSQYREAVEGGGNGEVKEVVKEVEEEADWSEALTGLSSFFFLLPFLCSYH